MKVIIKEPGEPIGHFAEIDNTLEAMQEIVGGYIETITFPGFVIVCNEEGKIRGLPENFKLPNDTVVGTVIVCGTDDDEFTDVPICMFGWFEILKRYGNLFFGILKR